MKKLIYFLTYFLVIITTNGLIAQTIKTEKNYKLRWSSSFVNAIKSNDNSIYLSSVGMDSTGIEEFDYINTDLIKLDSNYNIIWNEECQKFSTNKLLFFNDNSEIVAINDFFRVHVGTFVGDFYPSVTKFNKNGDLVVKNVDTISDQSGRLDYGVMIRFGTDKFITAVNYYNKLDSVIGIIFKYYDENGNFIKEDSTGLFKRTNSRFQILLREILLNDDNTYTIVAHVQDKKLSDTSFLCIIGFNNKQSANSLSFLGPYVNFNVIDAKIMKDGQISILTSLTDEIKKTTTNQIFLFNRNNLSKRIFTISQFDEIIMTNLNVSSNGSIYLAGYEWKYDEQKYSFFLAKLKDTNDVDWSLIWGEDGNSKSINNLLIEEENGLITAYGKNHSNSYLAIISIPTNIEDNNNSGSFVSISPNPANDYIEIFVGVQRTVPDKVAIFDILGMEVTTPSLRDTPPYQGGEIVQLDISGLAPGIYFIRVGDVVRKFVKI